ncbi:hypothetical protein K3495_g5075 [Podosphaera aphanis]|nr:hypothetical protein K3495_g5075 [Podosphaera aphanis]
MMPMESIRSEAGERFVETPVANNRIPHSSSLGTNITNVRADTVLTWWVETAWRRRWLPQKGNRQEATWRSRWSVSTLNLYEELKKHEMSALMLLRTEIIGLNAWLASIGVPETSPNCSCGEHIQTVKHILLYCPEHAELSSRMLIDAGTTNFSQLLITSRGCRAAARMLLATDRLQQFVIAIEIERETSNLTTTITLQD